MSEENKYRFKVHFRILIVAIVVLLSVFSTAIALPLADLLNLNLSELQGPGFNPTFKNLIIIILFAALWFLLIWLVMRFIHKRSIKTLGFKGPILKPLLWGTAIGFLLRAIHFFLLFLFGSGEVNLTLCIPADVSILAFIGYFLLNVLLLLNLNSLKEELVFRAYPIEQFNDYPKLMIPLLVMISAAFSGVHYIIEPFTLQSFLYGFTFALIVSFVYYRWRSIWLIVGLHNGVNLFVNLLLRGQYKQGGLFSFTMETWPSEITHIVIYVTVNIIFILLFNYIWKREKQTNKLIFNIKHSESIT